MQKADKQITYFTDDEYIIQEYKRIQKVIRKIDKAKVFLFEDEEEGYPERKLICCEVQKPFPDGIIFIAQSSDIYEIIGHLQDYLIY